MELRILKDLAGEILELRILKDLAGEILELRILKDLRVLSGPFGVDAKLVARV